VARLDHLTQGLDPGSFYLESRGYNGVEISNRSPAAMHPSLRAPSRVQYLSDFLKPRPVNLM
jgi:hypothetical protein